MTPTPDVTVVVCTYNRAELLADALHSLLQLETAQRFTYEILVVDNGSTDDTADVCEAFMRDARLACRYVREDRPGVAAARNRGIRAARGAWIAYCDDDQLADSTWLAELLRLAEQRGARVVGGTIELVGERTAQPLSPVYQRLLAPGGRGRSVQPFSRRDALNSGNSMAHRSVFEQVGLYDEASEAGGEDTEWFLRLLAAGITAWYTPRAIMRHRVPDYRQTSDYLRWLSLRQGWNRARIDIRRRGIAAAIAAALLRAGQALVIHRPLGIYARARGFEERALERQCGWWRAAGYVRHTLGHVLPGLCSQAAFREEIEFRSERTQFVAADVRGSSPADEAAAAQTAEGIPA